MPRVLLSGRWLALHALAIAATLTCVALAWWQVGRAEAGNGRSLGYALQWPGFALFVFGVWLWLCRDAIRGEEALPPCAGPPAPYRLPDDVVLPPLRPTASDPVAGSDADPDPELDAFNDLLARLHAKDRP